VTATLEALMDGPKRRWAVPAWLLPPSLFPFLLPASMPWRPSPRKEWTERGQRIPVTRPKERRNSVSSARNP
jgi:hypothetical protein